MRADSLTAWTARSLFAGLYPLSHASGRWTLSPDLLASSFVLIVYELLLCPAVVKQ